MLSSLFDVGEYDYNHVRTQPLWNDFGAKRKSLTEVADAAVKIMNVDQKTAKTIYKRLQTYSKNKIKQGQTEVEIVPDDRPISRNRLYLCSLLYSVYNWYGPDASAAIRTYLESGRTDLTNFEREFRPFLAPDG